MELVSDIYRLTANFPKEELYGLTSQMRRAAVSIPSNLAEGHGRSSSKEFHQFIGHSRGSLMELETQIEIARNLEFVSHAAAAALLDRTDEIGKMLTGLREWAAARANY